MNNLPVNVVLIDLPCAIRGFTRQDPDGCTIFLNARLSREQNLKTYLHELSHIEGRHLDRGIDVQEAELAAHGLK